mgnify:CR=1 FL=1
MKLLLDTHSLLWALLDDQMISSVKELINNQNNEIFVSTASLWEIEIKHSMRPDTMPFSSDEIVDVLEKRTDFTILPVKQSHISRLNSFINQGIHKDPFDHMLLSVAAAEDIYLLTHDEKTGKYQGVRLIQF